MENNYSEVEVNLVYMHFNLSVRQGIYPLCVSQKYKIKFLGGQILRDNETLNGHGRSSSLLSLITEEGSLINLFHCFDIPYLFLLKEYKIDLSKFN